MDWPPLAIQTGMGTAFIQILDRLGRYSQGLYIAAVSSLGKEEFTSHGGCALCAFERCPVRYRHSVHESVRCPLMNIEYWVGGILSVGLTIYLLVALLYPERF
jgi:K+-transporting ATPase KdpF subunit